jgi:uncharacterized protein YacL
MSADFISRVIGAILLAATGAVLGVYLAPLNSPPYWYVVLFMFIGALFGLILTPYVTVRPFVALRKSIRQAPVQKLLAVVIGLIVGLIIAALFSFPLSILPSPFNQILPFVAAIFLSYLFITIFWMREADIFNTIRGRLPSWGGDMAEGAGLGARKPVLLDTSVIIDGRIADISHTGFIDGEMIVPRFVLGELQHIADSPDTLRRNRGRRGLDMLRRLQEESITPVQITDRDIEEAREVDDKLVLLAKRLRCPIITNDYNLNRVAELQGVRVLNINELANAVKALFLPGESLAVEIVQEGKEAGQGVGYLDDGTMVVVEDGKSHVNRAVNVIVTKVLQTAAGRMLFARLD